MAKQCWQRHYVFNHFHYNIATAELKITSSSLNWVSWHYVELYDEIAQCIIINIQPLPETNLNQFVTNFNRNLCVCAKGQIEWTYIAQEGTCWNNTPTLVKLQNNIENIILGGMANMYTFIAILSDINSACKGVIDVTNTRPLIEAVIIKPNIAMTLALLTASFLVKYHLRRSTVTVV